MFVEQIAGAFKPNVFSTWRYITSLSSTNTLTSIRLSSITDVRVFQVEIFPGISCITWPMQIIITSVRTCLCTCFFFVFCLNCWRTTAQLLKSLRAILPPDWWNERKKTMADKPARGTHVGFGSVPFSYDTVAWKSFSKLMAVTTVSPGDSNFVSERWR